YSEHEPEKYYKMMMESMKNAAAATVATTTVAASTVPTATESNTVAARPSLDELIVADNTSVATSVAAPTLDSKERIKEEMRKKREYYQKKAEAAKNKSYPADGSSSAAPK